MRGDHVDGPHREAVSRMSSQTLQISKRAAPQGLTLEQERFNFLVSQIEQAREQRRDLEALMQRHRQEFSQKLQPVRASLSATCRTTVLAMDGLLSQRGWSKWETRCLKGLLCDTAEALIAANPADEELKTLYRKHSDIAFDAAKQEDLQRLKEHAEEFMGLDLGDEEALSEEDLIQRVYEQMAEREAEAQAQRDAKKSARKKSAAQQRSEDNARLARESLREVYRRLASALHPDREPDPTAREKKNELMQRINQAYAQNDLLTLFETQMEIEQMQAQQISKASTERMKQYNKLLAEQLTGLKNATKEIEDAFRSDFSLPPTGPISEGKLRIYVQTQARHLRAEISRQQQLLDVLKNKASTKRWLKQQRRLLDRFDEADEGMD
jgi:hypothetical protein